MDNRASNGQAQGKGLTESAGTGTERGKTERDVVLAVRNLKKKAGKRWIIRGISFDVHAGEIFGFLGPNGSGKTTTIRMLADLIRPTEGTVTICGHDLAREREAALSRIGLIVEHPDMYPFLTGRENLRHFARMTPGISDGRIDEVAELVGLDRRLDDKVKTYSLGMRQRLGIAQALLSDPKLLILDEPTNGLDPQGIRELRQFLRRLAERGIGLVVSSHLLSEIELMCDRVAIISEGRTIAVSGVRELLARAESRVLVKTGNPGAALRLLEEAGFAAEPHGDDADGAGETAGKETGGPGRPAGTVAVRMREEDVPRLVRLLLDAGIDLYAVKQHKPTLEDLFLALTGGMPIV